MKKIVIGIIIVVLLIGIYISWRIYFTKKTEQNFIAIRSGNKTLYIPKAQNEAEVTQSKINRAKGELRMLNTGLEAYKMDNKEYPQNLYALSTPIAYILRVPKDVFNENAYLQYRKTAEGFMVWSIGPDKKDDHGELSYDSTAGLNSPGDITRHQEETN